MFYHFLTDEADAQLRKQNSQFLSPESSFPQIHEGQNHIKINVGSGASAILAALDFDDEIDNNMKCTDNSHKESFNECDEFGEDSSSILAFPRVNGLNALDFLSLPRYADEFFRPAVEDLLPENLLCKNATSKMLNKSIKNNSVNLVFYSAMSNIRELLRTQLPQTLKMVLRDDTNVGFSDISTLVRIKHFFKTSIMYALQLIERSSQTIIDSVDVSINRHDRIHIHLHDSFSFSNCIHLFRSSVNIIIEALQYLRGISRVGDDLVPIKNEKLLSLVDIFFSESWNVAVVGRNGWSYVEYVDGSGNVMDPAVIYSLVLSAKTDSTVQIPEFFSRSVDIPEVPNPDFAILLISIGLTSLSACLTRIHESFEQSKTKLLRFLPKSVTPTPVARSSSSSGVSPSRPSSSPSKLSSKTTTSASKSSWGVASRSAASLNLVHSLKRAKETRHEDSSKSELLLSNNTDHIPYMQTLLENVPDLIVSPDIAGALRRPLPPVPIAEDLLNNDSMDELLEESPLNRIDERNLPPPMNTITTTLSFQVVSSPPPLQHILTIAIN